MCTLGINTFVICLFKGKWFFFFCDLYFDFSGDLLGWDSRMNYV